MEDKDLTNLCDVLEVRSISQAARALSCLSTEIGSAVNVYKLFLCHPCFFAKNAVLEDNDLVQR